MLVSPFARRPSQVVSGLLVGLCVICFLAFSPSEPTATQLAQRQVIGKIQRQVIGTYHVAHTRETSFRSLASSQAASQPAMSDMQTAPPVKTKQADYDGLWSYNEAEGNAPKQWPTLFSSVNGRGACDGVSQSPINIQTNATLYQNSHDLGWLKVKYQQNKGLGVTNMRHTIRLTGDALNYDQVLFEDKSWWLHEVTFHRKSETTVNGEHFELEAQLLHFEKTGSMLIISVLFHLSDQAAPFLSTLNWKHLPNKAGVGSGVSSDIDMTKLLPGWLDLWHYTGSLTVPPCTEGVHWLVMKNSMPVSNDQLKHFPFANNRRPVQLLNGRNVTDYHFTSAPSAVPTPLNTTSTLSPATTSSSGLIGGGSNSTDMDAILKKEAQAIAAWSKR